MSARDEAAEQAQGGVSRVSVSLPGPLLEDLDRLVVRRGYGSRSQAVADLVNAQVIESKRELGDEVMAGTITLHYDRSIPGLQAKLADLQYEHIAEVISSLHVHLTHNQVLEVVIVQGRAGRLQEIADSMITRRGVIGGRLQLHAAVIPPIQVPVKKLRQA
jgi:CopG family nickel-responsive transcriptional regulator